MHSRFLPVRKTALRLAAVVVAGLILSAANPADSFGRSLGQRLTAIANKAGPASGVYIYDATTGQTLVNRRGSKPRILASNAKLFTTAAALATFGPSGTITTAVSGDGSLTGGIYSGNLYLIGGGDPLFGSDAFVGRRYGTAASAEQLAAKVVALGVTTVTGNIYGDDSMFDRLPGTAATGFKTSSEIGGKLSALAFDRGVIYPTGAKFQGDQDRYAAARLRDALKDLDVQVGGRVSRATAPTSTVRIVDVQSPSFAEIAALTNKPSDNFIAEMLMKRLGVSIGELATTAAGTDAAEAFTTSLGATVQLSDGSGLSRNDQASPRSVVQFLTGMASRSESSAFANSLAVPGVSGTLSTRMRGTRASRACAAKTGTLHDVSSLSGYCTSRDGHHMVFSFLMNNVWPPNARRLQDRLTVALARSSIGQAGTPSNDY